VYDLIHQILTGRVETGTNRTLAIFLFQDAKLMHRILDGQRRNDAEMYARALFAFCTTLTRIPARSAKPKGVRLGYMGHLTLIAEDVLLALEHFPPDLRPVLAACAPQPDWDEYIAGRYHETKERDTSLLGGGKPIGGRPGAAPGAWKVDEAEAAASVAGEGSTAGELHRAKSAHPAREPSADFGTLPGPDAYGEAEDESQHPTVRDRSLLCGRAWRSRHTTHCSSRAT
jgi:serine/threonine-protein phosphatase 6 regulatory subunit 3